MSARIHVLKVWPEQYRALADGRKTFEIRKQDRPFAVGDILRLQEWAPMDGHKSGGDYIGSPILTRLITYIVPGGEWGLPEGLCVMGLAS